MPEKYKSPSIFEPPYFILKIWYNDLSMENFRLKNEINALQNQLEGYKIRQSDLLRKLHEKTKHQIGIQP